MLEEEAAISAHIDRESAHRKTACTGFVYTITILFKIVKTSVPAHRNALLCECIDKPAADIHFRCIDH